MADTRQVRCKPYHDVLRHADPGRLRAPGDHKSRCPGWLGDPKLRRTLLSEALVDPDGGDDSFGRPKRLWNGLNGVYFVAVSTNEQSAYYNCYREEPTVLLDELQARALRSIADVQPQSPPRRSRR